MNSLTRLGDCEVCAANAAKYTCPKCEVKTCKLQCLKIHKKELECDGIRDKVKYVPLSKFTNLDLLSDYRLLEDATRKVETIRKESKRIRKFNNIPKHLLTLKNVLQKRNNTKIQFLPYHFNRHKQNTTFVRFKTGIITWKLELIFTQADNFKIYETCEETVKLSSVLHKYLDPQQYSNDSLKFYQSLGLSGLNFYIKAEMKSAEKYFELDPSLSIQECLKNKVVIEFPTIIVAFKDHAYMFETIDASDDEMDTNEAMSPVKYISKIVKKEEISNEKKNGNLLFNTEYSDLELSEDDL